MLEEITEEDFIYGENTTIDEDVLCTPGPGVPPVTKDGLDNFIEEKMR